MYHFCCVLVKHKHAENRSFRLGKFMVIAVIKLVSLIKVITSKVQALNLIHKFIITEVFFLNANKYICHVWVKQNIFKFRFNWIMNFIENKKQVLAEHFKSQISTVLKHWPLISDTSVITKRIHKSQNIHYVWSDIHVSRLYTLWLYYSWEMVPLLMLTGIQPTESANSLHTAY